MSTSRPRSRRSCKSRHYRNLWSRLIKKNSHQRLWQKWSFITLINAQSSLFTKNFQIFRSTAPAVSIASELCFHVYKSSQCGSFKIRIVSGFFSFCLCFSCSSLGVRGDLSVVYKMWCGSSLRRCRGSLDWFDQICIFFWCTVLVDAASDVGC